MERIGNKVSYIRKPLAKYSFVSAGLGIAALLFGCIAIGAAYYFQGDAPLSAAAVGFCSILTAVSAVVYGVLSFFEKEKNYILAKISVGISGTLVFLWLAVFFIS